MKSLTVVAYLEKHSVSFSQNRKTEELLSVDLTGATGTDEILKRVRTDPTVSFISMEDCDVTDTGIEYLASIPQLETLILWECPNVTPAAFRALEGHQRLECVNVREIDLDDIGLRSLSDIPNLSGLELFSCSNVTNGGMRHVAKMRKLTRLSLVANPLVTGEGFATIKALTSLATLSINSDNLLDSCLKHFASLTRLKYLWLSESPNITGAGFKHLSKLERLEILSATDTAVSDSSLRYIAQLRNLKSLGLAGTGVSDKGLRNLRGLLKIREITLSNTGVTERGKAELKKTFPRCVVTISQANDDELDISQFDEEYRWDHPPRCIKGFVNAPCRERATTTFQISCSCGSAHGSVLGYPLGKIDPKHAGQEFDSPLSFRCGKCSKLAKFIDADKHGYNGEIGSPAGGRGKGKRSIFQCPKCAGMLFAVFLHFQYDGGELDLKQDDSSISVEDYFSSFNAHDVCVVCETETRIAAFELA